MEDVLLRVRLREGMPLADLPDAGAAACAELLADGLIDDEAAAAGRLAPTRRGRLMADAVVQRLL